MVKIGKETVAETPGPTEWETEELQEARAESVPAFKAGTSEYEGFLVTQPRLLASLYLTIHFQMSGLELKSSWTHLITLSRNFVEARWRSFFPSTSLVKRCSSYKAGNSYLHHRAQNGSGAHPTSYPMGTRGSFLRSKAAGGVKLATHIHLASNWNN
jgi:hypothetical protein